MSELSQVARPYAKAVFDLAKDAKDYTKWTDQLAFLQAIMADEQLVQVLEDPNISNEQAGELVLSIGKGKLDKEGQNLVKLMAKNERLAAMNDVNQQFLEMRDNAEQVIEAQLITATKVDAEQKIAFEAALSRRLGKKIKLESQVDKDLIGGAVVRAGDWVVDGSVKAQLQDLVGAIGS